MNKMTQLCLALLLTMGISNCLFFMAPVDNLPETNNIESFLNIAGNQEVRDLIKAIESREYKNLTARKIYEFDGGSIEYKESLKEKYYNNLKSINDRYKENGQIRTLLTTAIRVENVDAVRTLVEESKADINVIENENYRNKNGMPKTPLDIAKDILEFRKKMKEIDQDALHKAKVEDPFGPSAAIIKAGEDPSLLANGLNDSSIIPPILQIIELLNNC